MLHLFLSSHATAFIYVSLLIIWSMTLTFAVWKLRRPKVESRLLQLSLVIIALESVRTLVENSYFGSIYSSAAGFFPKWIQETLSQPEWVLFPKLFSLIASAMIVYLLIVRWFLNEEREIDRNRLDRQRLEEELAARGRQLQESESQFKWIVQYAPIPTLVFAEDGEILTVNEAWCDISGYTKEEIRTIQDWTRLAYGERANEICGIIQSLFELDQRKHEGEFVIRTKQGEERIWDFSSAPIGRLPDGRRVVASMAHDVTAKRQAEREAIDVRTRFNAYTENSDDCFWSKDIVDGAFRTRYVSPAFSKIWGYDPHALYRDPTFWLEAIVPEDRERAGEAFARTGTDKVYLTTSYRIIDARGREAWIEDRMLPRLDAEGNVVGIDGIARDVTQRLALEQKLFHSQKLESLGVLAGGVAHDFNNLLTAILGFASMIRSHLQDSPTGQGYLAEIELAAKRASELCDHLLAYAGKRKITVETVNVGEIVAEISRIMRVSVPDRIAMTMNVDERSPTIDADPTQIRQVILNLITNASESIGDRDGSISITLNEFVPDDQAAACLSLRAGHEYLQLVVTDNGHGMDAETRQKIFDPFYSTKFIGRGLGLAVVMGIVRGHDGAIEVESAPDQGSEFRLYFPTVTANVPAPILEQAAERSI